MDGWLLIFCGRRNAGTRPELLEETWRGMRRPRKRGGDWRRVQASNKRKAQLSGEKVCVPRTRRGEPS